MQPYSHKIDGKKVVQELFVSFCSAIQPLMSIYFLRAICRQLILFHKLAWWVAMGSGVPMLWWLAWGRNLICFCIFCRDCVVNGPLTLFAQLPKESHDQGVSLALAERNSRFRCLTDVHISNRSQLRSIVRKLRPKVCRSHWQACLCGSN